MDFAFPDWVESRLLPDDAFAAAYDSQSPAERACLKTVIARTAAIYGGPDVLRSVRLRVLRQGFSLGDSARPVNRAIIAWDEAYVSPSRILAAVLPAIMAGAVHVLAVRISPDAPPEPLPPSVVTALELAGQEQVATLTPAEAATLVRECVDLPGETRAVLLGQAAYLLDLGRDLTVAGIVHRHFRSPPTIGLDLASLPEDIALPPHGMLRFAHPDAAIVAFRDIPPPSLAAVVCGEQRDFMEHAPLVLRPGHEACWLWPDLGPDFFKRRSAAFGSVEHPAALPTE